MTDKEFEGTPEDIQYEKEQTLSDKIVNPNDWVEMIIRVKDVKEFIKKLKGFVNRLIIPSDILVKLDIQDEIDKLAGPKLVEQTQTKEVGK